MNNLGVVAQARGKLNEADDYFGRVLQILEQCAGQSLGLAAILNNLGVVARARGNWAPPTIIIFELSISKRTAPDSLELAD